MSDDEDILGEMADALYNLKRTERLEQQLGITDDMSNSQDFPDIYTLEEGTFKQHNSSTSENNEILTDTPVNDHSNEEEKENTKNSKKTIKKLKQLVEKKNIKKRQVKRITMPLQKTRRKKVKKDEEEHEEKKETKPIRKTIAKTKLKKKILTKITLKTIEKEISDSESETIKIPLKKQKAQKEKKSETKIKTSTKPIKKNKSETTINQKKKMTKKDLSDDGTLSTDKGGEKMKNDLTCADTQNELAISGTTERHETNDSELPTQIISSTHQTLPTTLILKSSDSQKHRKNIREYKLRDVQRPVIVLSMFNEKEVSAYKKACKSFATLDNDVTPNTTHVVVKREERTLKVVTAICLGRWVVNEEWIQECIEQHVVVNEKPFECFSNGRESVVGKRRDIFKNKYIKIGKLENYQYSLEKLMSLITFSGAIFQSVKKPFAIIGEEEKNLKPSWLFDSIILGKIQPRKQYEVHEE
ncbi:hypothetical protein EIN_097120 [Entamoeba invadens IP1]|uniref:BRCT domain-containing protein n=1 Tax=Entamoeba invadens IP1 TaxID=370355 RepID=A0A0A1U0M2_ENTIV|nr:hypothetical protein EIN_097120 [Entamoeba invadens IP1]ELP87445.1 hypothetical protein EIN_097120 [Entamoeba invadens IP1]|eukprot:XP_004254216.1 hypothetical protein EIN_097120 [Entamoeba invadens IP1]